MKHNHCLQIKLHMKLCTILARTQKMDPGLTQNIISQATYWPYIQATESVSIFLIYSLRIILRVCCYTLYSVAKNVPILLLFGIYFLFMTVRINCVGAGYILQSMQKVCICTGKRNTYVCIDSIFFV